MWKLLCGFLPMLACSFIAVPPSPTLPQESFCQYWTGPWAEEWWRAIPNPFCPRRCSLILKSPMEMHMVGLLLAHSPPTTGIIIHHTGGTPYQLFFVTVNKVKDDMKWLNENMIWHEEERFKSGVLVEWNWGNGSTSRKSQKIATLFTIIVTLATKIELGTPSRHRRTV